MSSEISTSNIQVGTRRARPAVSYRQPARKRTDRGRKIAIEEEDDAIVEPEQREEEPVVDILPLPRRPARKKTVRATNIAVEDDAIVEPEAELDEAAIVEPEAELDEAASVEPEEPRLAIDPMGRIKHDATSTEEEDIPRLESAKIDHPIRPIVRPYRSLFRSQSDDEEPEAIRLNPVARPAEIRGSLADAINVRKQGREERSNPPKTSIDSLVRPAPVQPSVQQVLQRSSMQYGESSDDDSDTDSVDWTGANLDYNAVTETQIFQPRGEVKAEPESDDEDVRVRLSNTSTQNVEQIPGVRELIDQRLRACRDKFRIALSGQESRAASTMHTMENAHAQEMMESTRNHKRVVNALEDEMKRQASEIVGAGDTEIKLREQLMNNIKLTEELQAANTKIEQLTEREARLKADHTDEFTEMEALAEGQEEEIATLSRVIEALIAKNDSLRDTEEEPVAPDDAPTDPVAPDDAPAESSRLSRIGHVLAVPIVAAVNAVKKMRSAAPVRKKSKRLSLLAMSI
jgi:hypothetical protein